MVQKMKIECELVHTKKFLLSGARQTLVDALGKGAGYGDVFLQRDHVIAQPADPVASLALELPSSLHSRLQLAFELVEEPPIRAAGNNLLRLI
jgi:hypothetical protein